MAIFQFVVERQHKNDGGINQCLLFATKLICYHSNFLSLISKNVKLIISTHHICQPGKFGKMVPYILRYLLGYADVCDILTQVHR